MKKFLSLLLCILLALTLIGCNNTDSDNSNGGGEKNPPETHVHTFVGNYNYCTDCNANIVSTHQQLSEYIHNISSYDISTIKLDCDITFPSAYNWSAVGFNNGTLVFDGDGHTIKGLKYQLFGSMLSVDLTVKNLNVEQSCLQEDTSWSGYAVSSVFGFVLLQGGHPYDDSNFLFENVHINNTVVTAVDYVGGFLAYVANQYGCITIKNCSLNANLTTTGGGSIGGVVGHCYGDIDIDGLDIKSTTVITNSADRKTFDRKVGGLVGTLQNGHYACVDSACHNSTYNPAMIIVKNVTNSATIYYCNGISLARPEVGANREMIGRAAEGQAEISVYSYTFNGAYLNLADQDV